MSAVRGQAVAYSLRFDEPPRDVLVHSVSQVPGRMTFGLTGCHMAFTYTGHLDAPHKLYASSVGEVVSCMVCIAYGL